MLCQPEFSDLAECGFVGEINTIGKVLLDPVKFFNDRFSRLAVYRNPATAAIGMITDLDLALPLFPLWSVSDIAFVVSTLL